MQNRRIGVYYFVLFSACLLLPSSLPAGGKMGLSDGQTLYVPAYSHIYIGNREKPFLLTITISIRNINPVDPITVNLVDYYESQGKLLKKCMDKPVILNPLGSLRYVIPERDKTGGSGANFIVEWESTRLVNPPVIESIMIGAQSQQGISFTSRGRVINPSK
jgi:hypothetical protein